MQIVRSAHTRVPDDLLFGSSERMQELRRRIDQIAEAGLPVLIEGESGTGKEVLARSIHGRSSRRERSFLKINCCEWVAVAPLTETVFGDRSDRSTADDSVLEDSSVGTVFFDDIGELAFAAQGAISVFLQDPRTSESGASRVQVISTTRTPLLPKLITGSFRSDLYYRVNVVSLALPPLRDRRVDIPALAQYFFKLYSETHHCNPEPFSARLVDAFVAADWPGNIRELENAVKRYVLLGSVEPITASFEEQTGSVLRPSSTDCSLKELRRTAVRECEYNAILSSLNRNQWNRRKTAADLGISYRSLLYLMEQLEFPRKREVTNGRDAQGAKHT
jgi:two-component system, NtrC family, response regulator AtoC